MERTIILPVTGAAPVAFQGEQCAEGTTDTAEYWGRGYTVKVYRRDEDGALLAHVRYWTQWPQEVETDVVLGATDAEALAVRLLDNYSPLAPVVGYPPGRQFEDKQARLVRAMQQQWRALAGRVLADVVAATRG